MANRSMTNRVWHGLLVGRVLPRSQRHCLQASSGTRVSKSHTRYGAILIIVLACVAIASIVFMSIAKVVGAQRRSTQKEVWRMEATWLAESGLQRAAARLADDADYSGETWNLTAEQLGLADAAVVKIEIDALPDAPNQRTVRVRADYPNHPQHRCRYTKSVAVWLPAPRDTDQPSSEEKP